MSLTKEEIIEFTRDNINGLKEIELDQVVIQVWIEFFERLNYNPYVEQNIVFRHNESEPKYNIRWIPETIIYGDIQQPYFKTVYLGIGEYSEFGSGNVRPMKFEK